MRIKILFEIKVHTIQEKVMEGWTTAKAFSNDIFINQDRNLEARRCLNTVLVSTINNAYQGLVHVTAPFEKSKSLGSRGSMVTSLELKGIDGSEPETTRSGVCGLIWLNIGKLTRSGHSKDWQTNSSFLILWVMVYGRS